MRTCTHARVQDLIGKRGQVNTDKQILSFCLLSLQVGSMFAPTFLLPLYYMNIANRDLMRNHSVRDEHVLLGVGTGGEKKW